MSARPARGQPATAGADRPFRPLDGIRVLDLTHFLAGPFSGWMLATLGAEVVKVERPDGGDLMRRTAADAEPPFSPGMGAAFVSVNAGKRSIAIDFKAPDGLAVVKRLAERADVFIESFRSGALDAAGLGYADLHALNPRLIYCSISGFGHAGPMRGVRAFDHIMQAVSGVMAATGDPDGPPMKAGFALSDTGTGQSAATAILAALLERERTGAGRFLDVPMIESVFALMAPQATGAMATGQPPPRDGNSAFTRNPTAATFPTADGYLLIGANTDPQVRRLFAALGHEDKLAEPCFETVAARRENEALVRGLIVSALAARSARDWEGVLQRAGVPAAVIRSLDETLADPALCDPGYARATAVDGVQGPVRLPGAPFRVDGGRPFAAAPPPRLGADTRAILTELGLDGPAIARLSEDGTILCAPAAG